MAATEALNQLNCQRCVFFMPTKEDDSLGKCRRNPPVMSYSPEDEIWVVNFPVILKPETTWCGEYLHPEETTDE